MTVEHEVRMSLIPKIDVGDDEVEIRSILWAYSLVS
jgi:hypothetical protein